MGVAARFDLVYFPGKNAGGGALSPAQHCCSKVVCVGMVQTKTEKTGQSRNVLFILRHSLAKLLFTQVGIEFADPPASASQFSGITDVHLHSQPNDHFFMPK